MKLNTNKKLSWWDRIMVAVTFAEANESKTSLEYVGDKPCREKDSSACGCLEANHGFAK